jgi:hypothetical protein
VAESFQSDMLPATNDSEGSAENAAGVAPASEAQASEPGPSEAGEVSGEEGAGESPRNEASVDETIETHASKASD